MTPKTDRVTELLEGRKRNRMEIVSPEGVVLDVEIADNWSRLGAFILDFLFWILALFLLYFLASLSLDVFSSEDSSLIGNALFSLFAFLIRIFYFIHFELAWQGRSPGKVICGLRVIDRKGGPLTPAAIFARNLTREFEVFLPIQLYLIMSISYGLDGWQQLALFLWSLTFAALPMFNRQRLRCGDLIGGTLVIAMPKHALLEDLSQRADSEQSTFTQSYTFTRHQLAAYGAFELQVLEEMLRRPRTFETDQLMEQVCGKICQKIDWTEPVASTDTRRFLNAFYAAERGELEREQLYGRYRADKTQSTASSTPPPRHWEALHRNKSPAKREN